LTSGAECMRPGSKDTRTGDTDGHILSGELRDGVAFDCW
jgi:hypothetical protein